MSQNDVKIDNAKQNKQDTRRKLMWAYYHDETCMPFEGKVKSIAKDHIVFGNLSVECGQFDYDGGATYEMQNVRVPKEAFLTLKQAVDMELIEIEEDDNESKWVEFKDISVGDEIEFEADIEKRKHKNKPATYHIVNILDIRIVKRKSPHFRENLKRWAEYGMPVKIRAHIDEIKYDLNLACLNDVLILDCDYLNEFIDGIETHVWVPFIEIKKVGIWENDVVEFYANTYEYENSKGEFNYGLKNIRNVKISDPRDRIIRDAQSLFCDAICMFRDHCWGICCANKEWKDGMIQQMALTMCGESGICPGTTAERLTDFEWDFVLGRLEDSEDAEDSEDCEDYKDYGENCDLNSESKYPDNRQKVRGVVYKLEKNKAKVRVFRFVNYNGLGRNVDDKIIEIELQNKHQQYGLFDIVELTGTVFCSKRNMEKPENERRYKIVDFEDVKVLTKDEVIEIAAKESVCDSCILHKWCKGWDQCAMGNLTNNEWLGKCTTQKLEETRAHLVYYRDTIINNMVEHLNNMVYSPDKSWNNVIDFMFHRYRHAEGIEPLFAQYLKIEE